MGQREAKGCVCVENKYDTSQKLAQCNNFTWKAKLSHESSSFKEVDKLVWLQERHLDTSADIL